MQQLEEHYQSLVDSIPDYSIYLLDPQGYILTSNQGAFQVKGYTAKEIIGKHFSLFYPPEEVAGNKPIRNLQLAARQGHYEEEGWRIRKDQGMFWAHVVIIPVLDEQRKLVSFYKVTRDLTAQRPYPGVPLVQNQPGRLDSQLLSTIIESSPAGMILFSPELNSSGDVIDFRFKLVNQTSAAKVGRTVGELTGSTLKSLFTDIETQPVWQHLLHCHLTGSSQQHAEKCPGEPVDSWIDGSFIKLQQDVLWVFQDVTQLKQAQLDTETKLRDLHQAKQQMEVDLSRLKLAEQEVARAFEREHEMNTLKTEFVKLVSHQFKTPMTSIVLNAEILKRHSERSSDEAFARRVVDYSQQVIQAIDRLNRLINKVLVHERMNLGQIAMQTEPLDLVAVCKDLVQQQEAATRPIVFHSAKPELWIEGDRTLLEQVIDNLISNALKYSADSEKAIEVTLKSTQKMCSISVKDYGIGIPAEEIKHLTKSFFRASNTTQYPGTGLGLSLSQQIVKMHGGQVSIKSEQNHYTHITVSLPLRQTQKDRALMLYH